MYEVPVSSLLPSSLAQLPHALLPGSHCTYLWLPHAGKWVKQPIGPMAMLPCEILRCAIWGLGLALQAI